MKLFVSILVIATMISWPSKSSDDDYNRGYDHGYDDGWWDGWYDTCEEIFFYDVEMVESLQWAGIC